LFPSLYKLYSGDLSDLISKHHPKDVIIGQSELFESYGLRHTFKSRYQAAGVEEKYGMYLFGHKSKETTKVHDNYAKGARHENDWLELEERMLMINATKDWATHKKYSDFDPE
jgi:integrase